METRITVNGRSYNSVDEMPPEDRKQYERVIGMLADRDGNGVPDVLEGKGLPGSFSPAHGPGVVTVTQTNFSINGKTYERLEDVPPELQHVLRDAAIGTARGMENTSLQLTAPRLMFNSNDKSSRLTLLFTPTMLIAFILAAIVTALIIWKFF